MVHGIISVLIFVFVVVLYGELRKWLIKRKLRNFESLNEMPILGVIPQFWGKSNDEAMNMFLNFFKEVKTTAFQMWLGPVLIIGVSEPEDIGIILTSDDCLNKTHIYKFLCCPTTIIASDKEIWKPDRRALNTAFKLKVLQGLFPSLNEKSRILISKMEPLLKGSGDMYRTIYIGHMNAISRTLFGWDMDVQNDKSVASLSEAFIEVMKTIQYRIPRFWYHLDWIFKTSKTGRLQQDYRNKVDAQFKYIYEQKVKEVRERKISYSDKIKDENTVNILEKLIIMELIGIFEHQKVLENIRMFFLAGTDTSSTTVFCTLLMLAMYPDHQERVIEEMQSIFESDDCDVTHDHLVRMSYLERVIKEVLRLLPPIPIISRKTSADIELARGTIPKGTYIFINLLHLHRNPKIWGEDVLKFDPDRFLQDNIAKRPPFSYIPFSAGSRNCIAMKYAMMSAKIVLAHLLRRYKFTTKLKFEDIHFDVNIFLGITNENPIQIEERYFK